MDAIREENELQEHLDALKIGESFYCKKKEITFIKLSEQETSEKIDQILQRNCTEEPSSHEKQKETLLKEMELNPKGYCHLCKEFQLLEEDGGSFRSFDCSAWENFICSDPHCGIYQKFYTCAND